MNERLRILHLEDEPDYADLVNLLLLNEGIDAEIRLVSTRDEFQKAFDAGKYDLVIADYMLPDWNGLNALKLVRDKSPEIPFLLLSGNVAEDQAIESLRDGVTDYVFKNLPERLVPAVNRAVREAQERVRRKRAESALSTSEMLFQSVWENSVDGMRLTDENGLIIAVNQAYCALMGCSRHLLEGKPFTTVCSRDEDPEQLLSQYREIFQERVREYQSERNLTLANGRTITLEVTTSFVEQRGHPPLLLSLFRDVSKHKRLEEQFRQSQKMEAIGQLAGGVAHDFNNLLTVIHGHASLLLADEQNQDATTASAQQIVQAAERAASLTRQLLTFSRRQVLQTQRLDMNNVIGNISAMLGRILGEDIALQVRYWGQPALLQADNGMIEQILLNLAVNARDAMPRGGQLNIQITRQEVNQKHIEQHPQARPGNFICLAVSDTGCGIPANILPRIFDPFFTTKESDKGTGLGLATVYGIVKQHRGWIEVESEVDHGTTFRVFLPALDEIPDEKLESKPVETTVRGGNETILIVEDEQSVRELVSCLLKKRGYRVLEAESGAKALSIWLEEKDSIDLVLTDMVMPDRLTGLELAETLRADRPDLKIIFTSGYSENVMGNEGVLRSGVNYLPKPYHPQTLALAVREQLDSRETSAK